ncbi:hypothetical protein ACOME3_002029 [Neoechinorhynchus agilis]
MIPIGSIRWLFRFNLDRRLVTIRSKYTLPDLSYDKHELEPYISAKTLDFHWGKHHQTYVNNLNAAIEGVEDAQLKGDFGTVGRLSDVVRFNAGGHLNHSLYWEMLCPQGGPSPSGKLLELIKNQFCSLDELIKRMSAQSVAVQGSGWGWLVFNDQSKALELTTTQNQDILPTHKVPLLTIDVWEHAYYLQYQNNRANYVNDIFNIVNWKYAENALAKHVL